MLKFVLLLGLAFAAEPKDALGSVGQCPLVAPGTVGPCLVACTEDSCPQGQKCCSNGCGRVCKPVVSVGGCVCGQPCTMEGGGSGVCQADYKTCAVNIQAPQCGGPVHAGKCPIQAPGTVGICIHGCNNDGNCAQDEKCCSNGCGRTCQKVATSSCVCGQPCKMAGGGSGVCQADRKTCAVNIQAPQCGDVEHPGKCPFVARDTLGICVDRCSNDDGCAKDEKCCFNGCGKTCIKLNSCVCGTPCKMSGGGSGVCQDDNKTCAVNVMAPQCGKGKGKAVAGKSCRKKCPTGQRCLAGACVAN